MQAPVNTAAVNVTLQVTVPLAPPPPPPTVNLMQLQVDAPAVPTTTVGTATDSFSMRNAQSQTAQWLYGTSRTPPLHPTPLGNHIHIIPPAQFLSTRRALTHTAAAALRRAAPPRQLTPTRGRHVIAEIQRLHLQRRAPHHRGFDHQQLPS